MPDEDHKDVLTGACNDDEVIIELRPDLREIIAQAIHKTYRQTRRGKINSDDLSTVPWDKLPDNLKESNRQQVDHVFDKLHRIGCTVHKVTHRDIVRMTLAEDEVKAMAEMEHARWCNERLRNGWSWGAKKDVTKKVSPYLVPWAELPSEVKEWDIQAVKNMPELLARVGLEIRRE